MSDMAACIRAARALIAELPNRAGDDIPYEWIVSCAWPFVRTNVSTMLIFLELILDKECQRRSPRSLESRVAEMLEGGRPPGHYSKGLISESVFDRATRTGALNAGEKEFLLGLESYSRLAPESVTTSVVGELEKGVDCVEAVSCRCVKGEEVTQEIAKPAAPTPLPAMVQAPSPVASSKHVRLALEERLNCLFEREIPGTLGTILVFRRPHPDTSPQRIAVKTIFPGNVRRQASHRAIDRLVHEVRHWINYRHSRLVLPPLWTEVVDGWPYIVMPYCECTLRDYIDGKVPQRGQAEAIALMVQCVTALEYARQHGMHAHQDLKPENILLVDVSMRFGADYPFAWQAKLADFGLANAYQELHLPWGSRPYLAPEQYEPGTDLSKVDVFACGVILHELLTGLHPVGERTSDIWPEPRPEKPRKWKHEEPWKHWAHSSKKVDRTAVDLRGNFRDIVEKTLQTNPQDRASLEELRCALLDALKRTDDAAYTNLRVLLEYFHFATLNSSILDAGIDRYQMENLEKLRTGEDLL